MDLGLERSSTKNALKTFLANFDGQNLKIRCFKTSEVNIKALGARIITQLPSIPLQVSLKILSTVRTRDRGHE
jgi:hypothetical protein